MYIGLVMMRRLIAEYFSFTQKERIAVIALVFLILAMYMLPRVVRPDADPPSEAEMKAFRIAEQRLAQSKDSRKTNEQDTRAYRYAETGQDNDIDETDVRRTMNAAVSTYDDSRPARLFYFDPNTLDEAGWKELGLRPKTIGTIRNYLSKGGHFYKPADLKKIYGLHPAEYGRIEPYIRITAREGNVRRNGVYVDRGGASDQSFNAPEGHSQSWTYEKKTSNHAGRADVGYIGTGTRFSKKEPDPVDVNTADTSAFIALPGIGARLAARIINFRERLGGFHSIDQLSEVYGLPDSTFRKIRSWLRISSSVKKIDINTAGLDVLKQHPYIRWNIAKAIVAYREQHGTFKSLEELQHIGVIDDSVFRKILPYIN